MAAIPGLAALFGVVALAYDQAMNHNNQNSHINDGLNRIGRLEMEQTGICSSVQFKKFMEQILFESFI